MHRRSVGLLRDGPFTEASRRRRSCREQQGTELEQSCHFFLSVTAALTRAKVSHFCQRADKNGDVGVEGRVLRVRGAKMNENENGRQQSGVHSGFSVVPRATLGHDPLCI